MSYNSADNYISCCFNQAGKGNQDDSIVPVEIYYARTEDLVSELPWLAVYVDNDERLKADKFHFETDRNTYILCHSFLRKVISNKLKRDPSEISLIYDGNNKPWLIGNPLFFNISHTREAFAFAISDSARVGIDIEDVDRRINFEPIINSFFSPGEIEYILTDPDLSRDRFFLLWTRKESLLKALGTGIIIKLEDVEVFRDINLISRESFENIVDDQYFCNHYLYSKKIDNHYLSLAVPHKADISFHYLNSETVKTIL